MLLAAPLNAEILRALRNGPKQQADLRRETGQPAQTTLRAQLKRLHAANAVETHRRNRFPGVLEYELSDAGRELLLVIEVLERWLAAAPQGELELGGSSARAAVKALTDGWSTTMLRALAVKSLSLTELDGVISSHNYPFLERRLSAMRLAGLVEACEGEGRGTPYSVTAWCCAGAAPLMLATRWERRHALADSPPMAKLDVETVFLLATELLSIPAADLSGSCRLTVDIGSDRGPTLAGIFVLLREGQIVSRSTRLEGDPDAWASAPLSTWLAAMIERDQAALELGGNTALARRLIDELHSTLFAVPVTRTAFPSPSAEPAPFGDNNISAK